MNLSSRIGQQLIEYMLLFAIVVIILILFINFGPLKNTVTQAINLTIDQINKEAEKL